MVVDNHVFPRVLVTIAGAFTSGLTGVLAFVMLALEGTHQTGMIYAGLAVFALFTAVAELLTVASFATDRKMVTWLGWAVAPGHAAGGVGVRVSADDDRGELDDGWFGELCFGGWDGVRREGGQLAGV